MAFISSTQIGTLIFDNIPKKLSNYHEIVTYALKGYLLSNEELELISQDLMNATNKDISSKKSLIEYFAYKAQHTPSIVKNYIVQANQGRTRASKLHV